MSDVLSAPIALFHVGIDWAAQTHVVCILDETSRVRSTFPIQHTPDGFAKLIQQLGNCGPCPCGELRTIDELLNPPP